MAKINEQKQSRQVMFSKLENDSLWYDIGHWLVQHVNLLIGWAMVAVSVALEPLAQQPQDVLFTVQQIELANEYATFIARVMQIVAVVMGMFFMIKDKRKNGKG